MFVIFTARLQPNGSCGLKTAQYSLFNSLFMLHLIKYCNITISYCGITTMAEVTRLFPVHMVITVIFLTSQQFYNWNMTRVIVSYYTFVFCTTLSYLLTCHMTRKMQPPKLTWYGPHSEGQGVADCSCYQGCWWGQTLRGQGQGRGLTFEAEARSIKWHINDTGNLSSKLIFMTENDQQSMLLNQITCNKQVTVSWKWQKIAIDMVSVSQI